MDMSKSMSEWERKRMAKIDEVVMFINCRKSSWKSHLFRLDREREEIERSFKARK